MDPSCPPSLHGRDTAARRYDAWFAIGWGARAWPVEAAAVLDAIGAKSRRVLDVGCGTGRLAALLAARGATVIGVDVDPGMLSSRPTAFPGGSCAATRHGYPSLTKASTLR